MAGFASLVVWREAAALVGAVTEVAKRFRGIGAAKAADQVVRAADSIAANIAEGYGRGVSADGLRFFKIARASADEVENHLRVAGLTHRVADQLVEEPVKHTIRVRYLIIRYAASIERRLGNTQP